MNCYITLILTTFQVPINYLKQSNLHYILGCESCNQLLVVTILYGTDVASHGTYVVLIIPV